MRTALVVLFSAVFAAAQPATELWVRGYSVIPAPQDVRLEPGEVELDSSWGVDPSGAGGDRSALAALNSGFREFHSLSFRSGAGGKTIRLSMKPDTVKPRADPGVVPQAYRLRIGESSIEITGNAAPGLFYGVQTLVQLARRDANGRLVVPRGAIEDWPDLQLRFLHWDTKHHQDRIETLERFLDWSARFKINMIGFELEDKFEYPSHPVIGAPGAFTTKELQELVNYGLERHIQVVPQIQAPAHMAYVLKHPEFATLRADGMNYQACMCDPRAQELIFSMYDDAIKATKGVDYLFVSTDEVYYAGICDKCGKPYNPVNRSLAWVDFVRKAHDFLSARGRRMLVWAEFPLLAEHVKLLPEGIIDGDIGEASYLPFEKERGIRQLAYASIQGAELLYPNQFSLDGRTGNLEAAYESVTNGRAWQGNPIGAFGAAWDDSGLHNETFWLGWATVAQYAWNRRGPSLNQHVAEFMNVFYGPRVTGMADLYRSLQQQARAWERTWERIPSTAVTYRYGSYFGKGIGTHRTDMTLAAPLINDLPDWFPDPFWAERYKDWIAEARRRAVENERLLEALQANLGRADRNRYNLDVLMALTRFIGHHWRLFLELERAENQIKEGQGLALQDKPAEAIARLTDAWNTVDRLQKERAAVFGELKAVFEKSRYEKGRAVGGRKFVHVFDDVKDHFADRRPDLSYMTAPEESIGLDNWNEELASNIRAYARTVGVAAGGLGK